MRLLTDLLERFSKSLNKNTLLKEEIESVIRGKIGRVPESINLKNGILEIVANPTLKNEIRLKEEQILKELPHVSRVIYK